MPTAVLWTPFKLQGRRVAEALRTLDGLLLHHVASEEEAVELVAMADFAILSGIGGGFSPRIAEAVHAAPRLRWIQVLSTGMDEIEAHGPPPHVEISGIGSCGAPVVAEHALALLLALVRQLPRAVHNATAGRWDRASFGSLASIEGMRIGLVGCGGIGQAVAHRANAFGAQCVGFNASGRNPAPDAITSVLPISRRHEMLSACDALVFSLPGNAAPGLFTAAEWTRCKHGVFVVNVGRGAVIDTGGLVEALHAGLVAAAALDVTETEPLPQDSPLWAAPNLLVTPHVAGAGGERTAERLCELVVHNMALRMERL